MEELFLNYRKTGDRGAIDALVRGHAPWVYRVCLSITRDPALAEDAAQETFLRMIRSAPTYQEGRPFRGWLCRIAQNAARTILSHRRMTTMETRDLDQRAGKDGDARLAVREAVAALDAEHRAPVELHYFHGFSYREVAEVLEVPEGTVASRLSAARERLKYVLAGAGIALSWGDLEVAMGQFGAEAVPETLADRISAVVEASVPAKAPAVATGAGFFAAKWLVSGGFAVAILGTSLWAYRHKKDGDVHPPSSGPVSESKAWAKGKKGPAARTGLPISTARLAEVSEEDLKRAVEAGLLEGAAKPPEDEENAATHYRRAMAIWAEGAPSLADRYAKFFPEETKREDFLKAVGEDPERRAEIERFLADCAGMLAHLHRAVEVDRCQFIDMAKVLEEASSGSDLSGLLLPHVPGLRTILRVFLLEAFQSEYQGKARDALGLYLSGLKVSDHAGQGGTLVEHLAALGIGSMGFRNLEEFLQRQADPSMDWEVVTKVPSLLQQRAYQMDPLVERSERAMASFGTKDAVHAICFGIRAKLREERPDLLEKAEKEGLLDPGKLAPPLSEQIDRTEESIFRAIREKDLGRLHAMQRDVEAQQAGWGASLREWEALMAGTFEMKKPDPSGEEEEIDRAKAQALEWAIRAVEDPAFLKDRISSATSGLFLPAFDRVARENGKKRFERNAFFIRLASRARRRDQGRFPAGLSSLGGVLPPEVFEDPFVHGRIRERPVAGGFLFWSVGPDLVDDGGDPEKDLVVRIGPEEKK